MKKFNLWVSIISSIVGIISGALYYILVGTNVIVAHKISYLFLLGYIATSWIPFILQLLLKIKIDKVANIVYQLFLFFSILVGSLWGMYGSMPSYDIILHTMSGLVIAFIAYSLFKNSKKNNSLSLAWLFVLIFSITMMCGGLWEIWEFSTDILLGGDSQRVGDLVGRAAIMDTMIDILCDFVGGIVGSIFVVLIERKCRKYSNTEKSSFINNEISVK